MACLSNTARLPQYYKERLCAVKPAALQKTTKTLAARKFIIQDKQRESWYSSGKLMPRSGIIVLTPLWQTKFL